MKRLLVLWLLLSVSIVTAQAQRPGTYAFSKRSGAHVARIVLRTRAFDTSKHKVGYAANSQTTIDGHLAYGAESTPRTEIAALYFSFDGWRIPISRRLYADCYEANISPDRGLAITFSRDFQRVFVSMFGADGAGSYHVIWVLGRNGRHRRYFKPTF
jgi:hypothetical protein